MAMLYHRYTYDTSGFGCYKPVFKNIYNIMAYQIKNRLLWSFDSSVEGKMLNKSAQESINTFHFRQAVMILIYQYKNIPRICVYIYQQHHRTGRYQLLHSQIQKKTWTSKLPLWTSAAFLGRKKQPKQTTKTNNQNKQHTWSRIIFPS